MSRAAFAVALVALLALAACPAVPVPLEPPRVELAGTSQRAGEDGGLIVALELNVTNPNDGALEARALDWQLAVDGEPVARGRDDLAVTLPPRAVTAVRARAVVPPGAAARLGEALGRGGGQASIEATGTLHCFGRQGAITAAIR